MTRPAPAFSGRRRCASPTTHSPKLCRLSRGRHWRPWHCRCALVACVLQRTVGGGGALVCWACHMAPRVHAGRPFGQWACAWPAVPAVGSALHCLSLSRSSPDPELFPARAAPAAAAVGAASGASFQSAPGVLPAHPQTLSLDFEVAARSHAALARLPSLSCLWLVAASGQVGVAAPALQARVGYWVEWGLLVDF